MERLAEIKFESGRTMTIPERILWEYINAKG